MKTKDAKTRCTNAASLADPKFRKRVVKARKGKGSYNRKGQLDKQ